MQLEGLLVHDDIFDSDSYSIHRLGDPTTVLFGENSAGKTTVLEAVKTILSGKRFFPVRRPVPGHSPIGTTVRLLLKPNPGRVEEVALMASALVSRDAVPQGALGPGVPLDEIVKAVVAPDGLDDPRGRFVADVLLHGLVVTNGEHGWLLVDREHLSPAGLDAARNLDAVAVAGGDRVTDLAVEIVAAGRAERLLICDMADIQRVSGLRVVSVPVEPTSVNAQARKALVDAYHLVLGGMEWDDDGWRGDSPTWKPLGPAEKGEVATISWGADEESTVEFLPSGMDSWLTIVGDQDPENPDDITYQVNPLLKKVASALGAAANRIAPGFVADAGQLELVVTDPRAWSSNPDRVEVVVREPLGGPPVSVDSLGAGTRRWAGAAFAFVAAALPNQIYPVDADDLDYDPLEFASESAAVADFYGVQTRDERRIIDLEDGIVSGLRGLVILIDEPEAHLHPKAVADVAEWLLATAPTARAVLVATHSLQILNLDSALVTRVLMHGGCYRPIVGALAEELTLYAPALGISQADLLLLQQGILFVEGPHDLAIIDAWIGDRLRRAGVLVLPAHGTAEMRGLLQAEVVSALGLRIAVLTDRTDSSRSTDRTTEERAVSRLKREAALAGRKVKDFGLSKPDILQYLPDDVCVSKAPRFPGWVKAVSDWELAGRSPDLKRFCKKEYGLSHHRAFVADLAQITAQAGRVPGEIEILGREIEAWATNAR